MRDAWSGRSGSAARCSTATWAPTRAAAAQANALAAGRAAYLLTAYQALLTGLGTSYDELRLAPVADPADPQRAGRPAGPDHQPVWRSAGRRARPADARPPRPCRRRRRPAQALDEANIERLFGLADTTRNPLSDGPVIGDPTGLITRWNLDGVSWGRNTDPDGTIYLWLAQPGAGEFDVALYKDQALTQLVAFGQLSPARYRASRPASRVAPENNSGLSGAIEVTQATETQAISLRRHPAAHLLAAADPARRLADRRPSRRPIHGRDQRRPARPAARWA